MLYLIPLFPLVGFLINGCWYAFAQTRPGANKASSYVTGSIATLAIGLSFVVSLVCFMHLRGMGEERVITETLYPWMTIGAFNLDMGFRLDSLNTLFTLVITGIGTLIHLYSIGYMSHDETPGKFFAYLNLFCFSMLMLVLGSSLPILFFGWEGVGLCSYLLIGYWYTDIEKAKAGKKAFIVNRIGDFGFLLGMFLIYTTFNTLDFETLRQVVVGVGGHGGGLPHGVEQATITAIALLLFVGCMGKSAQIPLYVWLPDAMAGPTPVSALIHAATMVTSGIYMVSRLNFIYSLSETALHVVAVVGAFTAFFAATIAIAQKDIKKVLAYSTVSQLGYMFLACGVGAYTAGVFHVITHAFFKALLFLGAGSVIHGMHEEQDIMKMGGLRAKMPKTFLTFAAGWIAICGIPPLSGFFSKDEILWMSFSSAHGSSVLWALGAATAVMTAFYMTRLFSLTFLGAPRFNESELGKTHGHAAAADAHADLGHDDHAHGDHADHSHGHGAKHDKKHDKKAPKNAAKHDDHGHHAPAGVHESPWTMTVPLQVLAVLSVVGGFIGIPHASWLEQWLEPVIPAHAANAAVSASMEWVLVGVSVLGAAFGIWVALNVYRDVRKSQPDPVEAKLGGLYGILENKWYVDELYEAVFVRPITVLSNLIWRGFDVAVIDRIVLGFGRATSWTGQTVRVLQTGSIQVYALMLLAGIILSVGYLVYGLS